MSDRESISRWFAQLAEKHEALANSDFEHRHYHRGIAILYRARVSDIDAELDLAA